MARFGGGTIYGRYGGIIGYYDKNGNAYNDKKEKIGYVRSWKLLMSREFKIERKEKIKPNDIWQFLGEILGEDSGSIYEDENCKEFKATYSLKNEEQYGAGAAYIVLVYEGLIESGKNSYYKIDV